MDWEKILFGEENALFLLEAALRTLIMFIVILLGLTLLGKRGVRQLSVFELVVIIGLGSAAGDPMFYRDVGILPAFVVFTVVISAYVLVMRLIGKSKKIEQALEGKPVYLIEEGEFAIHNFEKESLAQDEFFAELRLKGISQLGQVRLAIIETNGQISVFYQKEERVKPGLPLIPHLYNRHLKMITEDGEYSCTHCGYTTVFGDTGEKICPRCKKSKWVKSLDETRAV